MAAAGPAPTMVSQGSGAQATVHQTAAWYRGTPTGVPRSRDLAHLRAYGFTTLVWPSDLFSPPELSRLTEASALRLIVAPPDDALSCESALSPSSERVTVDVRAARAHAARAIAWRAVAHGARLVVFDPGPAYRYSDEADAAAWLAVAQEMARQFQANAPMFSALVPGPGLPVGPAPADARPDGLDVALLQTPRSWLLVATNCSAARVRSAIRLPRDIPAALWTSLIDGSEMSMRNAPDGPVWSADVAAGDVLVYLIEKRAG